MDKIVLFFYEIVVIGMKAFGVHVTKHDVDSVCFSMYGT